MSSTDTSSDIERLQIERWRQMSAAQKGAIVTGLTQAVHDLARAGVTHRYPTASPHEQFLRLAIVMLGRDLARVVYPDIGLLDLT